MDERSGVPGAGLSHDELADEAGAALLPPREQMSLISPGAVDGTPALELLPDEAQSRHRNPDDPHILTT